MIILHTADIHLGAVPDEGAYWAEERAAEIMSSFARLIKEAGRIRADFLLISGDLFHRQPLLSELNEVNYLFSQIPETTVVLCGGNHDCLSEDSAVPEFPWADNVIGLWGRECSSVPVRDKDTRVYGLSYYEKQSEANLYDRADILGNERFHILLLHGGDALHSPLDIRQLSSSGFDYIALGHIHKSGIVIPGKAAYPGSLEPLDRTETGEKGYIICELSEGTEPVISFVPFSDVRYEEITLNLKGMTSVYELKDMVRREIGKRGSRNIYTLLLTGNGYCTGTLRPDIFREEGRVLEIKDMTLSDEALKKAVAHNPEGLLADFLNAIRNNPGVSNEIRNAARREGLMAILKAAEKRGL